MEYGEALEVGKKIREQAARALSAWTGAQAIGVVAVKPACRANPEKNGTWAPVGRPCAKDIAVDHLPHREEDTHVLILDEDGYAVACTRRRHEFNEAVKLAERIPLPVAMENSSQLRRCLEEIELARNIRRTALMQDF